MKYSFTCPADGQVVSTEAKNDEEALKSLMAIGEKHFKEYHKGQPPLAEAEVKKFIMSMWKKG